MAVISGLFVDRYFWQSNFYQVSALFVLIGISIVVAGGFLLAFLWSVGNGQYDDDYTPSVRMLFDQENGNSEAGQATQSN